jgi:PTH1 family peptidyl-tRNA hydrolase
VGTGAALVCVGLGNPGEQYEATRHNVGAEVVELLARRHGGSLRRERLLHARAGSVQVGGRRLALGVPETFMNDSGLAVRALLHRYVDDDPARLVVVHDELDLEPGVVRVKAGGGTAGHNGLRSIQSHLHSLEFVRVRIGVGKPPSAARGAGHVLSRPGRADAEALGVARELAADAVELVLEQGVAAAMNATNSR